jgi:hypothetical protein
MLENQKVESRSEIMGEDFEKVTEIKWQDENQAM